MSGLRPFAIPTPRLLIRRLFLGEVDDFISCLTDSCPPHRRPWRSPLSTADAWAFATHHATIAPGCPNSHAWLAIVDVHSSRIVGVCSIFVDKSHQGDISVMLAPAWRGLGYEQECVAGLVFWARSASDGPRLRRVITRVDARDVCSLSAFGAAGLGLVSQGIWDGQIPYYILAI